ncbi:MAG: DUF1266 domain-containing protein [Bradyrhizobium sp.]|uniref:DUF1266 domain-containing protein n=1 Tax=Bradyrhizobium sp. TaxID=376 RepID=UPI0025BE3FFB|nr:DUF1266 domain-containing protein [Bradyrhizobium sp.]MBI5261093.1 DUF1266 domain-containing protein [Bradyrhizobium sp.]
MLKDWWDINGDTPAKRRNQAIDVLGWLATEGHRSSPEYAEPGDREAPKDLLAWDIARLVMVARHAFLATYITEEEGWAYVRDAAKMAQASFGSWQDYADRYNRGRSRWSGGPDETFDDAVEFLLKEPKSPWRTLDWNTPLKDEDFRNPVKHASKEGRARRDRVSRVVIIAGVVASVSVAVVNTVGRGRLDLSFGDWTRRTSTELPSKLSVMPKPFDLGAAPQERFSRINVDFVASRGEIIVYLRNIPVLMNEDFAAFRYGVNAATPSKIPEQKSGVRSVPSVLELPRDTRFLTIQVQFKDGSMSAIRRFDVPAGVLQTR